MNTLIMIITYTALHLTASMFLLLLIALMCRLSGRNIDHVFKNKAVMVLAWPMVALIIFLKVLEYTVKTISHRLWRVFNAY